MPKFIPAGQGKFMMLNDDGTGLLPWKYRQGHHKSEPGNYLSPVFSYVDHVNNKHFHWSIEDIQRMIAEKPEDYPIMEVRTTPENFKHVLVNNGIEPEHLERIKATPGRLDEPGIMLLWHRSDRETTGFDGDGTVIDGNHRMIARAMRGDAHMTYHTITLEQAMPAELLLPDDIGMKMVPPAVRIT